MPPKFPQSRARRPLRALVLGLGLALSAGPGVAQTAFQRLDTNGNSAISREEFLALRREMFARIDADQSGTVTRAEIEAARQASNRAGSGNRQMQADERIWSQDANGDGQLTLAEYTAQTRGFDMADRNRDGQLSAAEFDRIARFIAQAGN
ncbi:MAG: EF-hand domain-containing protein [Sphingomonadales bacterium]|nr:EF-hand domain-containing protein [Rhodobacterales bacterium]MBD3788149.1 EF-hand domain-containing protein [Sphingomonadales bacterium]